jgi:DNA-binding beta-propeller fold protein YncE
LFVSGWGSYGSGDGQFYNPGRIAVDPSGNVFVGDFGNNRIEKFDANGNFLMAWGSFGGGDGQFYNPTGLAVQFPQGNVYVYGAGNHRIQEFSNDGKFINKWILPLGISAPSVRGNDIAVDSAGNIFLTNANSSNVNIISTAPK